MTDEGKKQRNPRKKVTTLPAKLDKGVSPHDPVEIWVEMCYDGPALYALRKKQVEAGIVKPGNGAIVLGGILFEPDHPVKVKKSPDVTNWIELGYIQRAVAKW